MPAENESQATFFRLVKFFKKHHRMPPGAGKASSKIKHAASSMTREQLAHFMRTRKQ